MAYDIGDTVRVYGTFKVGTFTVTAGVPSVTYALADPTTVTLTVWTPAGVSTSYTYAGGTVTRDSLGVFYRDVPVAEAGRYVLRWTGTGAAAVVEDSIIAVRRARVIA